MLTNPYHDRDSVNCLCLAWAELSWAVGDWSCLLLGRSTIRCGGLSFKWFGETLEWHICITKTTTTQNTKSNNNKSVNFELYLHRLHIARDTDAMSFSSVSRKKCCVNCGAQRGRQLLPILRHNLVVWVTPIAAYPLRRFINLFSICSPNSSSNWAQRNAKSSSIHSMLFSAIAMVCPERDSNRKAKGKRHKLTMITLQVLSGIRCATSYPDQPRPWRSCSVAASSLPLWPTTASPPWSSIFRSWIASHSCILRR